MSACSRVLVRLTLLVAAEVHNEMEVEEESGAAPKTPGEPASSSRFRLSRGLSLWCCRRFRGLSLMTRVLIDLAKLLQLMCFPNKVKIHKFLFFPLRHGDSVSTNMDF